MPWTWDRRVGVGLHGRVEVSLRFEVEAFCMCYDSLHYYYEEGHHWAAGSRQGHA